MAARYFATPNPQHFTTVQQHCRPAHTLISIVSRMETTPLPTASPVETARRDCVFIVNPNGANGRTGRTWQTLFPKLTVELKDHYTLSAKLTTGPNDAVELTRDAIRGGAAVVVAVGGDGTLHEVVNGFFEDGKLLDKDPGNKDGTALGLIPLGTGSDFARMFGWDSDPLKAAGRIAKGQRRRIDVGRVLYGKKQTDGGMHERFFINVADLHLSAKAGFFAGQHKRLGNLCYVVGSLRGFQGHENRDLRIRVDGGEWETVSGVTAVCVGNSQYFGGGMKICPSADPFGGDLEAVILRDFKWYDFLLQLRKLYQGSHLELPNVTSVRMHTLDVEEVDTLDESYGGTFVQADGEALGFLNASFSVLPSVIDFIV